MSFTTYIPSPVLMPFVKQLAISENAESSTYKIIPDTSIVMGFQYSGKLSYTENDTSIPLTAAGITGLNDTFRLFTNAKNTGTVLVMFSGTGAAAFFGQPMHELFGESISLDYLVLRPEMDVVTERLCEAYSAEERIGIVETFLLSRLDPSMKDELVSLAVMLIKESKGMIRISQLASRLNISQSRLEKRFRKMVGASPKKFASIVRMRSVLSHDGVKDLTGLGLDSGYFDQAHFIKDFKSFTGQTPEQYFKQP